MKLTDDLYAYVWQGNDNNCNTYLFANVLSGNKHIIIDPGHIMTPYFHEPAYEILNKAFIHDGIKIEDIGLTILTHAHPDHSESAQKLKDNYETRIALHKEDAGMYKMFGGKKVDLFLEEGTLVLDDLIQEQLEILYTPGHAAGHVSIFWPAKKTLAVGDVVFHHNTGRVDLPGGNPPLLKSSIERLSKLDVEYLLCGHPYEGSGVIQGKAAVKENFDFLTKNIWF